MPVQPRPADAFTREHLLLGFPTVEFTPVGGSLVQLGILSAASIQKTIEVLQLERGDSGPITVDREILGRFEAGFEVETFNFSPNVAQLVFGAASTTLNSADPAATVVDEAIAIPVTNPTSFIGLANSLLDETPANITASCAPIVNELVGIGDGVLGTTDGDFTLAFKPNVLGDITRLEEINPVTGAVVRAFTPQAGEPAAELQAQVAVGATATSGQIDLFQAVGLGNELRADYTPSFTFEDDLAAANTDLVVDPLLGRVRFPNADAATGKVKGGQNMLIDYTYNRLANTSFQPFTRNQVEGSAVVRHLADVGSNFIWTIPSVTLRITDDDLTFGADSFVAAVLRLTINDAGGTARFGTMELSNETQSGN